MLADGVFASVALRGLTHFAPAYRTHTVDIMHTARDLHLPVANYDCRLEMLPVPVLQREHTGMAILDELCNQFLRHFQIKHTIRDNEPAGLLTALPLLFVMYHCAPATHGAGQ